MARGTHRITGIILAAIGFSLTCDPAFAAEPAPHPRGVNAREHRQAVRIREGVRRDEISRAELDQLRGDEAAIRAEERIYRRSGDGLSTREYRDLERDLNRTSREIRRATHNGSTAK